MNELKTKINDWVKLVNVSLECDKLFEDFITALEQMICVSQSAVRKVIKQPKRKLNILSTINESLSMSEIGIYSEINCIKPPLNGMPTNKLIAGEILPAFEIKQETTASSTISTPSTSKSIIDELDIISNKIGLHKSDNLLLSQTQSVKEEDQAPVLSQSSLIRNDESQPKALIICTQTKKLNVKDSLELVSSALLRINRIHLNHAQDPIENRDVTIPTLQTSTAFKKLEAKEKNTLCEEKQKQTRQVRANTEREKDELGAQLAREKRQKCKKILNCEEVRTGQEYEKRKILQFKRTEELHNNLAEIRKNLKISKYMEQKRVELQKNKLAEAKERRLLNVGHIHLKCAYENQQGENQKQYRFEFLESEDSTDEEDKPSTKKTPPPTWSLLKTRDPIIRQQNQIQWKIVDKLFSVQPTTVDLQEIFPTINLEYLHRNSSSIWATPPRYSNLPKY